MTVHEGSCGLIVLLTLTILVGSSTAETILPIDPFAAYELHKNQIPSDHHRIAESLIALGEIDRAIPHLESAGDRFNLGRAHFLYGKQDIAFRIFSECDSPEAHLLAGICVEDTDPLLALYHFRRTKDRLPMIDDYVSLKMGDVLLELGRVRQALSVLIRTIEKYPHLREREEITEELSQVYLKMGYPMLARRQLLNLLSRDYPRYRFSAALVEEEMGWNPEEVFREILREHSKTVWAVQSFEHLAQSGSLEAEDRLHGGIAHSSLKNYEKATELLHEYLKDSPESDLAHFELGVVWYKLAKYEDAYKLFSHVHGELEEDAIFYRARCRERSGDLEEALLEYRKIPGTSPDYPRARYYAGRLCEKTAKFDEALRDYRSLLKKFPSSSLADDACFRTGFLLHSLGRLKEATLQFTEFAQHYPQSPALDAALYWMAKSVDDDGERQAILAELVGMNPLGYYTKLAYDNFDLDLPRLEVQDNALSPDSLLDSPMRRGLLFLRLGLLPEAKRELSTVSPEHNYLLSIAYNQYAVTRNAISCAYRAGKKPLKILYPRTHVLTLNEVSQNSFLMLALIREESRFDQHAISRSGAIGLAQIMPATGAMIAEELDCRNFQTDSLFNAKTNLQFGSYYLEKMLRKFRNLEFALAAYNAGPHRVKKWLSELRYSSLDEFVENIPFSETRKYVKRVLGSYWSYSRIYGKPSREKKLGAIDSN